MWIDDQVLEASSETLCTKLWVPHDNLVVLGRSNSADREVNVDACHRDSVSILKRMGGGGTVLLHGGCLVVSVGCWVREFYHNDRYFRILNQAVMSTLQRQLDQIEFAQRGFSDIVLGQRKLAGTSLFRSRNYLLYQASILVEPRIDLIERYLQHPSAEPDYRKGRSHRDFLMGLAELTQKSAEEWQTHFAGIFPEVVRLGLQEELIKVPGDQISHILNRVGK